MNESAPKPIEEISPEQLPVDKAIGMVEDASLEVITSDEVVAAMRETLKNNEGTVSEKQTDMIIKALKETDGILQKLANLPKSVRQGVLTAFGVLALLAASPQWSEGSEKKGTKTRTEEVQKPQPASPQSIAEGFNSAVDVFGKGQLQQLDKSVTEMSRKVKETVDGVQKSMGAAVERTNSQPEQHISTPVSPENLKASLEAQIQVLEQQMKAAGSDFGKTYRLREQIADLNRQIKELSGGKDKDMEMLEQASKKMKGIDDSLQRLKKK